MTCKFPKDKFSEFQQKKNDPQEHVCPYKPTEWTPPAKKQMLNNESAEETATEISKLEQAFFIPVLCRRCESNSLSCRDAEHLRNVPLVSLWVAHLKGRNGFSKLMSYRLSRSRTIHQVGLTLFLPARTKKDYKNHYHHRRIFITTT